MKNKTTEPEKENAVDLLPVLSDIIPAAHPSIIVAVLLKASNKQLLKRFPSLKPRHIRQKALSYQDRGFDYIPHPECNNFNKVKGCQCNEVAKALYKSEKAKNSAIATEPAKPAKDENKTE